MPRGGWRPGSGRKKGTSGLKAEMARNLLREMVEAEIRPLVQAQIRNAKGLSYLVTRDKKTGKFVRVSAAMARRLEGKGTEVIEVWEKDPSVHAFADLLNRAYGKPVEALEVDFDGELKVSWEGDDDE